MYINDNKLNKCSFTIMNRIILSSIQYLCEKYYDMPQFNEQYVVFVALQVYIVHGS